MSDRDNAYEACIEEQKEKIYELLDEIERLKKALETESRERWKMMNERNAELAWSRTLASKIKELIAALDAAGALLVTRPARETLKEYEDAHS